VGDTDSHPRGRKVQGGGEVAIKAKGDDGSSHRRLGDFLRRDCTPSFVSSRFSYVFARAQETHFHHSAIPFRRFSCVRDVRKYSRCATEMHRQVGVALREL